MLKKKLFFFSFLIFSLFLYSQDYDYSQIKDNFSPRDEGSANELRLIRYIEGFCRNNDIEYKTEKVDNEKDIITNSFNIEINIKGNSPEHEKFIVICPLNTAILFQDNFDNSISVKIVLDLIKLCKELTFKKDLIFLFSGANERETPDYLGVKYFLQKNDELGKSFVTVIDILSNKNDIHFSGSVSGKPVPLDILKNYLNLADVAKLNIYFQRDEIYKSKFYLIPKDDYNSVFINNDIQCVTFSNKEKTIKNDFVFDEKYQAKLTEFFYKWILVFDKVKFPIDADFHYQYLNIFDFKIIISEMFQIILFLILIFIIIYVRFFFPRFQRLHYFLLIKGSPYFIIIFIIYFITSFIQYLIFIPMNNFSGNAGAFINHPILYFANIFLISLFIILLFFELIKKMPFPKHSYLYVYGALVFIGLNLIIFAFIDISISFVYLLAIIAVTISQYTGRKFTLKFILYFLSSIPLVMLFADLVFSGNMEVIKSLNPVILNLLFSIFTFPFILLALRVELFLRIKYKRIIKKSPFIIFLTVFIFVLLSLLIVFSTLYKPKSEKVFVKLINEVNKKSSHLLIESNGNIDEILTADGSAFRKINLKSNKMFVPVSTVKPPYKIEYKKVKDSYFNFNLRVNSDHLIEYLNIYMITSKDFYPLESNYNFEKHENYQGFDGIEAEGDVYKFLTPRNIGTNVFFKMAVLDQPFKIIVEIEYPYINFDNISIKIPNGIINKRTIFVEAIEVN